MASEALLIGVSDYSTYDTGAGLPRGASDLRGPANDLRLWASTFARLGVRARALSNPTAAEVRAALDALPADATVVFCGHGDADARGPLLCLGDTGPDLRAALPVAEVLERASTLFYDACQGGRGLGRRALRDAAPAPFPPTGDAVALTAGATAWEVEVHGAWHGAFSFAATALLDRAAAGLTWRDLLARLRASLDALGVDGRPAFEGALPALHGRVQGDAAPAPAAVARELNPGMNGYVIFDSGGKAIGTISVSSTRIDWRWTSQSASFPSTFTLKSSGTSPGDTPHVVSHEHNTFSGTAGTYSMSGVEYQIKQGGSVVGYLDRQASKHVWYATSAISDFAAAETQFIANPNSGSLTLYRCIDNFVP